MAAFGPFRPFCETGPDMNGKQTYGDAQVLGKGTGGTNGEGVAGASCTAGSSQGLAPHERLG